VLSAGLFFRPFKLLKAHHVGVYEADFFVVLPPPPNFWPVIYQFVLYIMPFSFNFRVFQLKKMASFLKKSHCKH